MYYGDRVTVVFTLVRDEGNVPSHWESGVFDSDGRGVAGVTGPTLGSVLDAALECMYEGDLFGGRVFFDANGGAG
jgi:hypothetical protein